MSWNAPTDWTYAGPIGVAVEELTVELVVETVKFDEVVAEDVMA
jgi:hypothetical protein